MIQKKNEKKKSARKDSPRCSFPLPFRLHALAAAALYLISPLPGVFADHTAIDLFTLALQPLAAWAAVAEPDPLAAVFQLSGRCSDHRRVSAALAVRVPCAVRGRALPAAVPCARFVGCAGGVRGVVVCAVTAALLTVGLVIPEARAGRVHPGPITLHDDARHCAPGRHEVRLGARVVCERRRRRLDWPC